VANVAWDVPQALDGVTDLLRRLPAVGPQAMHGPRQENQHGSSDKREILSHPWSLLLQAQLLLHATPTGAALSARSGSRPTRADPDRLSLCSSLAATARSGERTLIDSAAATCWLFESRGAGLARTVRSWTTRRLRRKSSIPRSASPSGIISQ